MKYRPENWDNPYEPIGADLDKMGRSIAFEAGADAMLEALFKMAKESPTGKFEIDSHVVNIFSKE